MAVGRCINFAEMGSRVALCIRITEINHGVHFLIGPSSWHDLLVSEIQPPGFPRPGTGCLHGDTRGLLAGRLPSGHGCLLLVVTLSQRSWRHFLLLIATLH
jgi:hypothetical protein